MTWTGKSCSATELATRAFDNLRTSAGATRWCVSGKPTTARPVSVAYQWATAGYAISSYRITSSGSSGIGVSRSQVSTGSGASEVSSVESARNEN